MTVIEQFTLVILLTLDCAFVAAFLDISSSGYKKSKFFIILVALYFSVLNLIISMLGYYLGERILPWIMNWDHWVVFIVFSYLAWKQWKWNPNENSQHLKVNKKTILILGALSTIDVFTVSLAMSDYLFSKSLYFFSIFLVTLLFTYMGPNLITVFRKKGTVLASKISSFILFIIGLKLLLEHVTHIN